MFVVVDSFTGFTLLGTESVFQYCILPLYVARILMCFCTAVCLFLSVFSLLMRLSEKVRLFISGHDCKDALFNPLYGNVCSLACVGGWWKWKKLIFVYASISCSTASVDRIWWHCVCFSLVFLNSNAVKELGMVQQVFDLVQTASSNRIFGISRLYSDWFQEVWTAENKIKLDFF